MQLNHQRRTYPTLAEYERILKINESNETPGQPNQDILQFIRKWFLDPPSELPYKLMEDHPRVNFPDYKEFSPSWMFINSVLMDLFKDKSPGFFVEAGALDGEHQSNTLQLERKLNWTGLLVEGDKSTYVRLKHKHRKCWSTPLCLATKPFIHEELFTSASLTQEVSWIFRASPKIQPNWSIPSFDDIGYPNFNKVLCVPTIHLIQALGVSHVDFFSLDVEGVEMDVLKNFPFDQITVDVWAIEHINPKDPGRGHNAKWPYIGPNNTYRFEDEKFVSFMENKGYYFFDMFCQEIPDYVFIRLNSKIFEQLAVPEKLRIRRNLCLPKGNYYSKDPADPSHLRDKRHWPSLNFSLNKN